MTFNSLPAYKKAGSIPSAGELAVELGYDPKRSWLPGDIPAEVFTLGDFQSSLNAERLNLNQIGQLSGLDIANLRIADIPFLQGATLSELIDAVPSLEAFTLKEIPALADIIGGDLEQTLAEVISLDSVIGDLKISDYLGDFSILEIPNLDLTALGNFANWQTWAIAEIPGLADIELGALSDAMAIFSGVTAMHDVTYGPKEHRVTLTKFSITGSDQVGFEVQCAQERGCSYLELEGPGRMHGAQWIAGGDGAGQQMVEGGRGLLAVISNGEEPTGRHPFGKAFKIVLTDTTESEGTGEFGLYFNICVSGAFFDLGCTPYFLGPIPMPLLNTKEKGMVITGLLDGKGGATSGIEAPEGWKDLRPETPQEVADFIRANTPKRPVFGGGLCGEGPGGVNFQSLAAAFSSIEGNYNSVGTYTSGGRGLGRYQYMSYRADVRESILQKPGGQAFLNKADRGGAISPAEVEQFFPAADQDALFRADQTRNIEQAISEGFSGTRIIERLGQIHFGGPAAPIDGNWADVHGRLTLKTYGEELAESYRQVEIQTESESQCKTGGLIAGKSIEEAIAYEQASFQDFDAYRAYRNGYHGGIDFDSRFGAGEGGAVVSVVGGKVTDVYPIATNRATGEGSMSVVVTSADSEGREITQIYTHLSASSVNSTVQVGTVVGSGQLLGTVGGEDSVSSGAHLDYKVKVNGVYVNPDEFMQAVIDGGGTLTTIDIRTGAKGTTPIGALVP